MQRTHAKMTPYIVSLTISGTLPSMKNQRRIVTNRKTGKLLSIKSEKAMDYEQVFLSQVPQKARVNYLGDVSLRVRVWYPSRRNDLDVSYLCDLLAKAEIIGNDRQIRHIDAWGGVSKDDPRVIFSLYPLGEPTAATKETVNF